MNSIENAVIDNIIVERAFDAFKQLPFIITRHIRHVFHDEGHWLQYFNKSDKLSIEIIQDLFIMILSLNTSKLPTSYPCKPLTGWPTNNDIHSRYIKVAQKLRRVNDARNILDHTL